MNEQTDLLQYQIINKQLNTKKHEYILYRIKRRQEI